MAIEYSETYEDRELTASLRRVNGQLIDTRWAGGWLTPKGEFHAVDYARGVTHETLAEFWGSKITGSGSISSRPPLMRLYDIEGWMRIVHLSGSTFCVQLKGQYHSADYPLESLCVMEPRQQTQLLRFAKDYRDFHSYYINETYYDSYFSFANAIRVGRITPFGLSILQQLRRRIFGEGISTLEFARSARLDPRTVDNVVEGDCRMSPEKLRPIIDYLVSGKQGDFDFERYDAAQRRRSERKRN